MHFFACLLKKDNECLVHLKISIISSFLRFTFKSDIVENDEFVRVLKLLCEEGNFQKF